MNFYKSLEDIFAAQRDHIILWLPVFLGLGICAYFGLKTEPAVGSTLLFLCSAALPWFGALVLRHRTEEGGAIAILLGLVFVFALGFAAAQMRTVFLAHPILQKDIKFATVEGTIRSVELLEEGKGARVMLKDLRIEHLAPEDTPQQIRLTVRKDAEIVPGQRIRALAGLKPPSKPVAPGSYDFERDAYFKNIGAFGFSFKAPVIVSGNTDDGGFAAKLQQYRAMLARRAEAKVSAPESSVVIALLNGDQRALPDSTWDDIRIAGLAHIIAISGANISMAAGIAFFLSRFLMALWPRFALYHPIKVYAAAIAFLAALAYALIVGMNVPTFRALVMTGLVLLAVAVNRSPFSLRMAAMSAFGLLLFYPEFLLGASFQMSFAAVVGLIVFYDLTRNVWTGLHRSANWFGRIFIYLGGIMVVTVLATIVTAPFSLANFQQFSTYGVIANAVVVPVVDFWIMPLAIVVYFLAPFGLEGWALHGMEAGVHFMLAVAHMIAAWPYAQLHGRVWPVGALGLMVCGVIFTIIWSGRLRWAGLMAVAAGICIVFMQHRPPDILISSSSKLAMIRLDDGTALLSQRRSDKFSAEIWMKEGGIDQAEIWPRAGVAEKGGVKIACEKDGCMADVKGVRIAFSFNPRTVAQDCRNAMIVIANSPAERRDCAAAALIDRWDLKDKGAHAIWIDAPQATIRNVTQVQGRRPWVQTSVYIDDETDD
ncbi:MAG: comEC/Rec2-related domain protein [Micavibrio sp.]|nr:comEC/Rec2-related domain protein [Micavibrio sp.]